MKRCVSVGGVVSEEACESVGGVATEWRQVNPLEALL